MGLFLDDERCPRHVTWIKLPNTLWAIVRTFNEFVWYIKNHPLPDYISFDHDLGMGQTGYDCIKFLVEYLLDHPSKDLPLLTFHSQNQIGVDAMKQYWGNYQRLSAI